MRQFSAVDRRTAAILFADPEGSAQLSKRMSTTSTSLSFREMSKAADDCVIDAGGLVGRHAGDGVAAVYPAEVQLRLAAAHACVSAAGSSKQTCGRSRNAMTSAGSLDSGERACTGERRSTSAASSHEAVLR